jgi:hypothetical protein
MNSISIFNRHNTQNEIIEKENKLSFDDEFESILGKEEFSILV